MFSKNSKKWHLISQTIPRIESGLEKNIDELQPSVDKSIGTKKTGKKNFSG